MKEVRTPTAKTDERLCGCGSETQSGQLSRCSVMITVAVLLLLLGAGRGVSSAREERDSNYVPRIDELLDVFNINRLTDGWQQAVTSGCGDDVTSLLSALKNRTFWAQKCEYKRHGVERILGWWLSLLRRMRGGDPRLESPSAGKLYRNSGVPRDFVREGRGFKKFS